jgi:hypothetical protein
MKGSLTGVRESKDTTDTDGVLVTKVNRLIRTPTLLARAIDIHAVHETYLLRVDDVSVLSTVNVPLLDFEVSGGLLPT